MGIQRIISVLGDEDEFGLYSFNVEGVSLSVENHKNKPFKIFPNPTQHSITLSNPSNYQLNSVQVIDINGRIIKKVDLVANIRKQAIQLEDIHSGIYFLKVNFENGAVIERIVKQ